MGTTAEVMDDDSVPMSTAEERFVFTHAVDEVEGRVVRCRDRTWDLCNQTLIIRGQ